MAGYLLVTVSVKFLEPVYPNQLITFLWFFFACVFSGIAIEFVKMKSSGETSKQPAKRNKLSK